MKKKFIFAALFGAVFLFSEEVSVFDAGNVNSENPYGLTENEQILLKNKQRLDQIQIKFLQLINKKLHKCKMILLG